MELLRDRSEEFRAGGVQPYAISRDSPWTHIAWQQVLELDFPLLSDFWPHGAVAKAYGVFNEQLGCANRASFVIDRDGKVVDTFASANLATPRARADYEAALAKVA